MVTITDHTTERSVPERFRLVAESSEDGVAILQDGRVALVNDRLCNLFGYSAAELTGMSPVDLAAQEERERLSQALAQVQEQGLPPKELEYWALRKDGSRRYVRQRFSSDYDSDGIPSRLVLISDLTTQEMAHQALADQESLLQQIMEASRALAAADDPEGMLRATVEPAMQAGAHAALLLVLHGDAGGRPEWAEFAAVCGEAKAPLGTRFYLPDSPQAGLPVPSSDRAVLIPDLGVTPQGTKEGIASIMGVKEVRALGILPLQAAHQWQGLIMIAWPEPHEFDPKEEQLYGLLAAFLASTLQGQRVPKPEHSAGLAQTAAAVHAAADQAAPTGAAPIEPARLEPAPADLAQSTPEEKLGLVEPVLEAALLSGEEDQARTLLATQAAQLATLFEVSQALAAAPLRREEIAGTVLRQFTKMMGVPQASISLHDPDTGLLNVMADLREGQEGARPVREPEVFRLADYPATKRVMETMEPLVVQANDPGSDPAELGFMQPRGIMTLIILPLAVTGQSIGIVELESTKKAVRCTSEDLRVAMTLANQAAVALESARLFEQAESALAEVQATHRSYLRQMWQEHLHQRRMLERSGFVLDQQQTDSPGSLVATDDLWRPEIERAVAEGEPIVVQDGEQGEERTSLAIPITVRGQTLGVIGVETPTPDREWTRDEIALVQAVSEQLGQALESARLFADTRRSAERERLIGEITAKIRSSADVRAILETTAAELGQVLGTSRTLVRIAPGGPEASRSQSPPPTAEPPARGQGPAAEESE
jgi:PAS domain S-box-containing protein